MARPLSHRTSICSIVFSVQVGLVHDPAEVQTVILDPRHGAWPKVVLPVLQDCSMSYLRGRSHRSASTVKRIRAGLTTPDPELMATLVRAAAEFARRRLKDWGVSVPRDDLAACYAYLARRNIWRKPIEISTNGDISEPPPQ